MKKYYKLMWLPGESPISDFNDVVNEESRFIHSKLQEYFVYQTWLSDYETEFRKWLRSEGSSIYDLNSELVKQSLNMAFKMNHYFAVRHIECQIFIWFDVDRDQFPKFKWELCPLSQIVLIDLGESVNAKNRFISQMFPLCFPENGGM